MAGLGSGRSFSCSSTSQSLAIEGLAAAMLSAGSGGSVSLPMAGMKMDYLSSMM